jgi:DHA1 family bicyclomycin/chloramphenicol resistance-like MFS transporter
VSEPPSEALPRRLLLILGALSGMAAISIDMYLPALPAIRSALGAPAGEVQLTLSAFFVGIAIGQLVYGPLSDRHGRRPVLIVGIALYIVASALCASAASVSHLIGWRFAQGVAASVGGVVARAIVRDVCTTDSAAQALSVIFIVMLAAPLLAPWVGGQVLAVAGWRAIFWLLTGFGALCLTAAALGLEETHPHRARSAAGLVPVIAAYAAVLRHGRTVGFILTGALFFAGFFAYLSGSPFVYIEVFGVAPEHYGYLFAINVVGIGTVTWLNSRLVGELGAERMLTMGVAVAAGGGLALLGVALTGLGGLWGVVACLVFYVSTIGLVAANSSAAALAPFPHIAGAGSAVIGAVQFGTGAVSGAVLGQLHDGTPVPMAAIMAASGIGALAARLALARHHPTGNTDRWTG